MSEEIVFNLLGKGEAEFAELLEARASDIHVMTGKVRPSTGGERIHSEIQIAIPGEGAIAETQYRTPDGRVRRQMMTERQISIIPAGQPHQFSNSCVEAGLMLNRDVDRIRPCSRTR